MSDTAEARRWLARVKRMERRTGKDFVLGMHCCPESVLSQYASCPQHPDVTYEDAIRAHGLDGINHGLGTLLGDVTPDRFAIP